MSDNEDYGDENNNVIDPSMSDNDDCYNETTCDAPEDKYNFRLLVDPVILISLNNISPSMSMHLINKLLFYTESDIFVSFTRNQEESSLIVSEKYFNKYKEENNSQYIREDGHITHGQLYSVFKIIEYSTEINKIGVVNSLSKIMADNEISILYITTFNNDYILVNYESTDKAVRALIAEGYVFDNCQ